MNEQQENLKEILMDVSSTYNFLNSLSESEYKILLDNIKEFEKSKIQNENKLYQSLKNVLYYFDVV